MNLAYQNQGIEKFLRKLVVENPDTDLWLTTVTATHPRTLRLKEIQYRVDAVHRGQSKCLMEASIEVSNDTSSPRDRQRQAASTKRVRPNLSLKYLDAEQRQHIVRLDGIDAPAKGQPFQTFRQQSDLSQFLSFDECFMQHAMSRCHI